MRKALKCLEVFHAFRVFLPRLSKMRSRSRLAFLLMCATCSRLAAVTLLAHLTLPARRFSRFGRGGCSIQKSQFFLCLRRIMISTKSFAFLFAQDLQNSPVI